jgi:hypothetical protein
MSQADAGTDFDPDVRDAGSRARVRCAAFETLERSTFQNEFSRLFHRPEGDQ